MKVAVTWKMCGYIDIDADNLTEAMENFYEDYDYIKPPEDGEYVDDSLQIDWSMSKSIEKRGGRTNNEK